MRRIQRITTDKLDIGCGKRKAEGYAGLDATDYGQEIVWDLCQGIPIPDNSIKTIRAFHILEHFTPRALQYLFFEIIRIAKEEATLYIEVPTAGSPQAFYLGHLSYWSENTIKGICSCFNNNGQGPRLELERLTQNERTINATIRIKK